MPPPPIPQQFSETPLSFRGGLRCRQEAALKKPAGRVESKVSMCTLGPTWRQTDTHTQTHTVKRITITMTMYVVWHKPTANIYIYIYIYIYIHTHV